MPFDLASNVLAKQIESARTRQQKAVEPKAGKSGTSKLQPLIDLSPRAQLCKDEVMKMAQRTLSSVGMPASGHSSKPGKSPRNTVSSKSPRGQAPRFSSTQATKSRLTPRAGKVAATPRSQPWPPKVRQQAKIFNQNDDPTVATNDVLFLKHVANGNHAAALEMIENGQNVNVADEFGRSAVHAAVSLPGAMLLKTLIAEGAFLDFADARGVRPIAVAAQGNRVDVMKLLHEAKAPNGTPAVNMSTPNPGTGSSLLHDAAWAGHEEAVHYLLDIDAFKQNIDAFNAKGQTALHLAAMRAPKAVVELLVNAGARHDVAEKTTQRIPSTAEGLAHSMARSDSAKFLGDLSVTLNTIKFAAKMKHTKSSPGLFPQMGKASRSPRA
jgi:hypothetical protein